MELFKLLTCFLVIYSHMATCDTSDKECSADMGSKVPVIPSATDKPLVETFALPSTVIEKEVNTAITVGEASIPLDHLGPMVGKDFCLVHL